MLNKKFWGILVFAVTFINVMMWIANPAYAAEEKYKLSEKALAPEYPVIEQFVCPSCKEVRVSPIKGQTLASMRMVCPACKNEASELEVHHCDKCGKDVLVCPICRNTSVKLSAETMVKCPICKEVRVRPIKGRTLTKWEMKCPVCKKTSKEWLIFHCDKCAKDFLACPICKNEEQPREAQEKAEK